MVLEGYGLTEAAPIVSVNRPGAYVFGSVGRPLDNVRVRLSDQGEILVKGPNVMMGYWGDASDGGASLDDDGWLHMKPSIIIEGSPSIACIAPITHHHVWSLN